MFMKSPVCIHAKFTIYTGIKDKTERFGNYGWNALFMCNTHRQSGRYDAQVIETLQNVDVIAAEDTRNSIKLLSAFDIHTPMTSYHEYNKVEKADQLIVQMQAGKNIALITDAGTPAISDPGEVLVQKCQEAGINVTSLPGPAACITALTLSGLPTRRFCFEGFLPADKKGEEGNPGGIGGRKPYHDIVRRPHHLVKTLTDLSETLGNRKITLCRELTKKFETILPTTIAEALQKYETEDPRGEYVLVIAGKSREEKKREQIVAWEDMSIEEHMAYYEKTGMDSKSAMKQVAKDRGVGKREIYDYLHKG